MTTKENAKETIVAPLAISQIAVSTTANGSYTTIVVLGNDNSMWRIVHIGNVETGQWSEWERIPPVYAT